MDKNYVLMFVIAAIVGIVLVGLFNSNITGHAGKTVTAQCKDHIDNDGDGYCDFVKKGAYCKDGSILGDKDCVSAEDNKEASDCVPSTEVCDNKDNDCDSFFDESLPVVCSSSSQCGVAGWSGAAFCGGDGNLYRNWVNYPCNNAGQCNSYCSVTNTTYFYQSCSGAGCSNGQCLFVNSCNESDGGINKFVAGNVSGTFNGFSYNYNDVCRTNVTLTEYYCSGGLAFNQTISCSINGSTYCSFGRCF